MTTRVIWVRQDASFRDMAAALREHRVSAFPVLDDDGKVIGRRLRGRHAGQGALEPSRDGMPGMITGLLRRKEQEKARGTTAGDLMTSPPVTVGPDDTVERAARLMYTRKVKRLPVVDADGHLAGIISRADVLAVFDRPDADIRQEISDNVILDEILVDPAAFDGDGRGRSGDAGRESRRPTSSATTSCSRVRHVHGVVAVRDRLNYPSRRPPRPLFRRPRRFLSQLMPAPNQEERQR